MLTHRRLNLPSCLLIKEIYPNFFENIIFEKLMCDACQLRKLKRKYDHYMGNRCQIPFSSYLVIYRDFQHMDIYH